MHRRPLFSPFGLTITLAALALAGFSVSVQAADDHTYTLVAADKASATFADDTAKRSRDGWIRLSILRVFDTGAIAYTNTQMMLHCGTQKAQTLDGVTYSRDGHRPTVTAAEAEATTIKPGTLGMVIKGYICDGADPYPRSKTLKSLDDALERAAELIEVEKAR